MDEKCIMYIVQYLNHYHCTIYRNSNFKDLTIKQHINYL